MVMTVAGAAKLLKKFNEEYSALLEDEAKRCRYTVAVGEPAESVRPEYDYTDVQAALREYEKKIRKLKHIINVFNTTYVVPEMGMTVDEILVLIPQLTRNKIKYGSMKAYLPKERHHDDYSRFSNIVEYDYTNYDTKCAQNDYDETSELLSKAQTALDNANSTATVEIDF